MKRILAIFLLLAVLVNLTGCFGFGFGGGDTTGPSEGALPYEGHYLVDLFDPYDGTRDSWYPTEIADNHVYEIETMTMANEQFQKGIKFTKVDKTFDMYLDYDIGGQYQSISFFYGMDSSMRWQIDFSVAFQVVNAETKEVIWEDLLRAGDVPKFATVDISGVQKLRLECYNTDTWGTFCMGDITLWEGESQAKDRSYPIITETTVLEGDYPFYHGISTVTMDDWCNDYKNFGVYETNPLSIKGQAFTHAALLTFNDDLVMNLRGQFRQVSFTLGIADKAHQVNSYVDDFKGYLSIYADGVCVLDEFICTVDTPVQTIVLDVNYAWQLRFVLRSDQEGYAPEFVLAELTGGSDVTGSGDTGSNAWVVPLIRTHYPHVISGGDMGAYAKVYDSSSRYHGFYMGGEKFIEGVALIPVWNLWDNKATPAYVVSDLEGKYKYITFTLGHIDAGAYKPALLEIYLDGAEEPSYTFAVGDTDMPKEYTIDVNYCRSIKFLCGGNAENNLPAIGIANLVCYPEEVVDNEIFQPYYADYPDTCELTDYFTPFGYASYGIDKIYYNDGIYADGKYFELYDGSQYKKGLLFCTCTEMNWDSVGFSAMYWMELAILTSPVSEKNSFFIFNLGGQYDTLTFKTGKAIGSNTGEFTMLLGEPVEEGEQYLYIFGDDSSQELYGCELVDGTIQEHTVDISGVERLVFCVPNNGTIMSEIYAAFDIILSKDAE